MAPLRFARVTSFSSEEPTHPATGLLAKVRVGEVVVMDMLMMNIVVTG